MLVPRRRSSTTMVWQVDQVMLYYGEIAYTYGISPPDTPSPASSSSSTSP